MAALGSIRKKGTILICIIGLGLFAFIAEEFMRSCEATSNESKMQVGEVLGEKSTYKSSRSLWRNILMSSRCKEARTICPRNR